MDFEELKRKIFFIKNDSDFESLALEIFKYQYYSNKVYQAFCDCFMSNPKTVFSFSKIPFLPVEFFKSQKVICGNKTADIVFKSSGTTSQSASIHYISDKEIYEASFTNTFIKFYGNPKDYCFLALLPNYLEKGDSSLVYMVNGLMQQSGNKDSGFYMNDYSSLCDKILELKSENQHIFLIGVSYALLDFAEHYPINLSGGIVMETGGMKGRTKEITREELHAFLIGQLNVESIHSEYGMTELLSQAYSLKEGKFRCPPWMKILVREMNDPLCYNKTDRIGGMNIIDLANIHSCSFIATQDLGKINNDGSFEVLGRLDHSDARGCNLMYI